MAGEGDDLKPLRKSGIVGQQHVARPGVEGLLPQLREGVAAEDKCRPKLCVADNGGLRPMGVDPAAGTRLQECVAADVVGVGVG